MDSLKNKSTVSSKNFIISNDSRKDKAGVMGNTVTQLTSFELNLEKLQEKISSNGFTVRLDRNTAPQIRNLVVKNVNYLGEYTIEYEINDVDVNRMTTYISISNGAYKEIGKDQSNGVYVYKGSGLLSGSYSCKLKVTDGVLYTIKDFVIDIPGAQQGNIFEEVELITNPNIKGGEFVRVAIRLKTGNISSGISINPVVSFGDTFTIKNVQFEKGNILTDWRSSTLETVRKMAQIDITTDAITSTVISHEDRIKEAEQKITPGAITNSVSESINGTGTINTVSTVLDKNGLTIKNGSIRVQNKAGANVLHGDLNGNLVMSGQITALSGKVGGFSINGDNLIGTNIGLCGRSGNNWAFWAGNNDSDLAPFRIAHSGNAVVTNLTINNGGLIVKNRFNENVIVGDGDGNLTFSGYIQGKDQQIKLMGDTMKIDGRNGALRFQFDSKNYLYISQQEGMRLFTSNVYANNIYAPSFYVASDGHFLIRNGGSCVKLIKHSGQVQSRNPDDTAYGNFMGSDFLNSSTVNSKVNIENTKDVDFIGVLLDAKIRKYNLKEDVEIALKTPGTLEESEEQNSYEVDTKLGVILEELPESVSKLIKPKHSEGVSLYSMISILWAVCQRQEERLAELEALSRENQNKI